MVLEHEIISSRANTISYLIPTLPALLFAKHRPPLLSSQLSVYQSAVDAGTAISTAASLADGIFLGFLFTSTALTLSLVLSKGGDLVRTGKMTQGDLTSYATYTFLLGAGAAGVAKARGEFKDGVEASGDVWRAIDGGGEGGV